MKRFLAILLVVVMVASVFVGCKKTDDPAVEPPKTEEPTPTPEPTPEEPAEGTIAKVGLGQVISIAKSKDKAEGATAQAQADVTIAAVGFDKDGKVVSVNIDVAQSKVAFDENMVVTSDKAVEVPTKKDLGADYGMKKASGIQKEWDEQIKALEEWMIGKTVAEITGMELKEGKPADADLVSSVTVSVGGYLEAVQEAWDKAVDAPGTEKVGLGIETHINKSRDAGKDKDGKDVLARAQFDTYMAATGFDKDGKITAALIDNAQVRVDYDADGKVTSDKEAPGKTKQELKNEYGMVKASEIGKEWYEQMVAFEEWLVGKTVKEMMDMPVKERDETHKHVPDVPELTSSVTITVEGYQAVVSEAYDTAR